MYLKNSTADDIHSTCNLFADHFSNVYNKPGNDNPLIDNHSQYGEYNSQLEMGGFKPRC